MLDALRDAEADRRRAARGRGPAGRDARHARVGTARHSETVGHYAEQIARELGFPAADIERVRAAGILHDIGKLGIADAILHKPGTLDDHEWAEMKRHPELGARILEHANLRDIAAWVRPPRARRRHAATRAARGDAIPVEARILAVADSYEAMTADRPYRKSPVARGRAEELRRNAGASSTAMSVRHRARARPLAGRLRRDARGARARRTARRARLRLLVTAAEQRADSEPA